MSEVLKSCPFCGGEARVISEFNDNTGVRRVKCRTCEASTRPFVFEIDATAIWNKRISGDGSTLLVNQHGGCMNTQNVNAAEMEAVKAAQLADDFVITGFAKVEGTWMAFGGIPGIRAPGDPNLVVTGKSVSGYETLALRDVAERLNALERDVTSHELTQSQGSGGSIGGGGGGN